TEFGRTDTLFSAIRFVGTGNFACKRKYRILHLLTAYLIDTHYILIRVLGFLQCLDNDIAVIGRDERELLTQCTPMFIGTESFQLLVQYLRLLYGDSLVKSAGMTHQTVCKAMMPEVLAVLVSIILVCFGG